MVYLMSQDKRNAIPDVSIWNSKYLLYVILTIKYKYKIKCIYIQNLISININIKLKI